ncbi:bifunctional DNA-formamidopyrimidine glycosylase/DNA-(apurinic or apyrimidinic site) lyase [Wenzhouxiangella sp. XN79A]|uniref:bifunctional DNA-formamidopyrimidine glycosylase/DNA-(apurinic or apyrimidinic site) lyase n=1 Tax=Wenzhouxiangella sp. XN79A TaxID=2724193 RepID=UPI00144ADB1D|nr:bifunctional DNA-formamidopyrimidine glycosylase/DNA-(apurinic or apyrimidinic site) lyase [Wenzhouxiangella sp. XN79A]NKI34189.1 bifunctional DNA-formamidopyrimidine glycosylase/DNA-(apurinic or apyrimidinic site) lyase [Wenzhouxiangella sp. XN79A]
MPELPEVETTRRGLDPLVTGRTIEAVTVRQPMLRWPVAREAAALAGCKVLALQRRAKWLLWRFEQGSLLWHLGMSGSFRGWNEAPGPGAHDHLDVVVRDGWTIRYTDPRRFGAVLWQPGDDPFVHPRLAGLGPEPLSDRFDGDHLWRLSRGRRAAVKTFIMDNAVVVGVGNIYAAESLFDAGIHPMRAAGRVSRARYAVLAETIRTTLTRAIEVGGTSLRDFTVGDGTPGYFGQELKVYGKAGEPCPVCGAEIKGAVIGQRATTWCSECQR